MNFSEFAKLVGLALRSLGSLGLDNGLLSPRLRPLREMRILRMLMIRRGFEQSEAWAALALRLLIVSIVDAFSAPVNAKTDYSDLGREGRLLVERFFLNKTEAALAQALNRALRTMQRDIHQAELALAAFLWTWEREQYENLAA